MKVLVESPAAFVAAFQKSSASPGVDVVKVTEEGAILALHDSGFGTQLEVSKFTEQPNEIEKLVSATRGALRSLGDIANLVEYDQTVCELALSASHDEWLIICTIANDVTSPLWGIAALVVSKR